MAQMTPDDPERPTTADPVVASPLRPTPIEAAPTLSSYAQAEAYQGVLDRAALHKTPGLYTRAWHVFRANKVAVVALCMLTLIVIFVLSAGIISAHVTGFTPQENHLRDKLKPPLTDGYILGSDGNGRDVLTRLAYGGRVSLRIAVLSAFGIFFLGGVIGLIAGYAGGMTDAIIMRVVDVGLSI